MAEYIPETHHSKTYTQCTYAVYRNPSGCDEKTVLYFFHGSGGDVHSWLHASLKITDTWNKHGYKSPLIVALTFGKDRLMFPEEASERGVHLETFVHDVMPEIEEHLEKKITKRFLYGFSIGGANVAQLFFRHPELFDKAVIASPQMYLIPPDASEEQINALAAAMPAQTGGAADWIKKNILRWNTTARNIHRELNQIKRNIPDPQSWCKADILANMKYAPKGKHNKVYISCGRQDENVFFPGAERLAAAASSHGYDVVFDPLSGGHMTLNENHIAVFLEK